MADELEGLRAEIAALRDEVGRLQDVEAVRRVQHAYGYYMDKGKYQEVVDLFAEDGELWFMGGVFRGRAGLTRLYCDRFRTSFTGGLNGPVFGFMLEHLQLQDIVDIAPDRRAAKARFRAFLQGGSHESRTDKSPLPDQWWEAGVYENDYVREDGVWKVKVMNYNLFWQADYDRGWRFSKPYPPGPFWKGTYPENPLGPDEIVGEGLPFWPNTPLVPYHYPHPVTGKWVT